MDSCAYLYILGGFSTQHNNPHQLCCGRYNKDTQTIRTVSRFNRNCDAVLFLLPLSSPPSPPYITVHHPHPPHSPSTFTLTLYIARISFIVLSVFRPPSHPVRPSLGLNLKVSVHWWSANNNNNNTTTGENTNLIPSFNGTRLLLLLDKISSSHRHSVLLLQWGI